VESAVVVALSVVEPGGQTNVSGPAFTTCASAPSEKQANMTAIMDFSFMYFFVF
jgi:hypothetical protein